MIDLATLFQEASAEHQPGEFPDFPTSAMGKSERQVIDSKNISGISGISDMLERVNGPSEFDEPQACAGAGASGRARGAYVDVSEMSEMPEKLNPASGWLSDSLSKKSEKKREVGKTEPLPAPLSVIAAPTFDERAAFLEYECGLSRAEAEAQAQAETAIVPAGKSAPRPTADGLAFWRAGLARLDPERVPCPGYRSDEWARVYELCGTFLDQFGEQAEALGWTAVRLFGVHPEAGVIRVDACGGLVLGTGGAVRAITATEIWFGHLKHRKLPGQPEGVLIWDFRR